MKTILKIMAVAGLAFTMASCGAVNDPSENNDPNNYPTNFPNDGTVYRAPDGTVYSRGDVYRDRDGNVYQNGRVVRTGDVYGNPGILGRSGNNTVYYPNNNARNLPPGQAKKIYGGSAKDYAPGQVKKRQRYYNNGQVIYDQNNRRFADDDKNKGNKKFKNQNGKRGDRDDD